MPRSGRAQAPDLNPPDLNLIYINRVFTRTNGVHALIGAKLKTQIRKAAARPNQTLWNRAGMVCGQFKSRECTNDFKAADHEPG